MGLFGNSGPDLSIEPLEERELQCPSCENELADGGVITQDLFDANYNTYRPEKFEGTLSQGDDDEEIRDKNKLGIGIGCPHCGILLSVVNYPRHTNRIAHHTEFTVDHTPVTESE